MIQYMSAREAAEKWNISQRRVSILCSESRIPDVAMLGNMWIIPRNAEKPVDARMKRNIILEKKDARPFVKWAGGKGQLLEVLKANLPDGLGEKITKYAEPFVGGGALLHTHNFFVIIQNRIAGFSVLQNQFLYIIQSVILPKNRKPPNLLIRGISEGGGMREIEL